MANEMANISDFLGKVHTTATVKTYSEVKNISLINDTDRMLIYPGEIIGKPYANRYLKRFLVKISQTSEANMMIALNNIQIGIIKLNTRQAIGSYTKPSTLVGMELFGSKKAFENPQTKRWDIDIWLDVEWTTS